MAEPDAAASDLEAGAGLPLRGAGALLPLSRTGTARSCRRDRSTSPAARRCSPTAPTPRPRRWPASSPRCRGWSCRCCGPSCDGFDVVYSAHVSPYGAVPATLHREPGNGRAGLRRPPDRRAAGAADRERAELRPDAARSTADRAGGGPRARRLHQPPRLPLARRLRGGAGGGRARRPHACPSSTSRRCSSASAPPSLPSSTSRRSSSPASSRRPGAASEFDPAIGGEVGARRRLDRREAAQRQAGDQA